MSSSTIVDRLRALLEGIAPFDRLPQEARERVLTDLSIEYFHSGEVVIAQGATQHKGLYIVESGTVRIMDVESQRLLDKCGEGDTFGSFGLLRGGATIYEVKAVEPTVCAVLKAERFHQLYARHEDFKAFFEDDLKRYVRHIDREMDVTGAHLLFSRRLNQFVHREPVTCTPDTTARQAATTMRREGVGSILVLQDGHLLGIVTDGDLAARLVARGLPADTPVRRLMSAPVATVPDDVPLFEAMMLMLNRRLNRLVIAERRDGADVPVAVLTDRDVAHLRGQDPIATMQRIRNAPSVAELVSIRTESSEQLLRLYRQGVPPEMINRILSEFYDCLAVRVLELAERDLRQKHADLRVDLPWVWMRLGSGGRQELVLNSQQHNALVYTNPSSPEQADRVERWLDLLAGRVNTDLASCGFTMSDIVARDARWRRPLRNWQQSYRAWVLQAQGTELAASPIFFDLRGIYGDHALVDVLKQDIEDALNVQALDADRRFLSLLAAQALESRPPLTLLGRFRVERRGAHRKTFDVRERGIRPVVDAARVFALEARYLASTNTFDRLQAAAAAFPELSKTLLEARDAYRFLVDFRLEEQLRAFEAGEKPTNYIDVLNLRKAQQNLLRNVFATVSELQDALAKRYNVPRRRSALER